MFKKLSASILALALVACVSGQALAQGDLAVYFDEAGTFKRFGETSGVFTISVIGNVQTNISAVEFVIGPVLNVDYAGVFPAGVVKINDTNLDLGDNSLGEYVLAVGGCLGSGTHEMVRLSYFDSTGSAIPNDVIMKVRGLQPGDTRPSSFFGEPGYVDCSNTKHALTLEPWPTDTEHARIDPTKDPNTDDAAGVCVLNALTVPNEHQSITALKARF